MHLDIDVPFVIVFTKFDLIVPEVSSSHNDREERCRSLFGNVPVDIIPTKVSPSYQQISRNNRWDSSEAQRTQPRMSLVPFAWPVSQRESRGIDILTDIEQVTSFLIMNLLSRAVRQSWAKHDTFRGQTLNCVEVIHADTVYIVGVWNRPNKGERSMDDRRQDPSRRRQKPGDREIIEAVGWSHIESC